MTASAVFILDVKGKVIISRNYRGDVPMNCVERFSGHVLEADEADERPVWLEHGTTYVYIKYNNLYIMAVTQRNSNVAMILLFLYRLVEVCVCVRGATSHTLARLAQTLHLAKPMCQPSLTSRARRGQATCLRALWQHC